MSQLQLAQIQQLGELLALVMVKLFCSMKLSFGAMMLFVWSPWTVSNG
jgi:hypothetical protein